jgi:hypothetical protein
MTAPIDLPARLATPAVKAAVPRRKCQRPPAELPFADGKTSSNSETVFLRTRQIVALGPRLNETLRIRAAGRSLTMVDLPPDRQFVAKSSHAVDPDSVMPCSCAKAHRAWTTAGSIPTPCSTPIRRIDHEPWS